ncbi:unnamed protein product, partial [Discosporangium mesarthrocarpum]
TVSPEDFWGHSHLGYGVTEVRERLWDYLVEKHMLQGNPGLEVFNPCSFVGHVEVWKGHRLVGTGNHLLCEEAMKGVLWGTVDKACGAAENQPCGIAGVPMPPVRGDFIAMSVFFYALHCMRHLGPAELPHWPKPSMAELREATESFCAMDWDMIGKDHPEGVALHAYTSKKGLPHRCVEAVYVTTLLRDGYGFPEHSRNVTFALEAEGMEVEWTLGFALSELAREMDNAEEEEKEEEKLWGLTNGGAAGGQELANAGLEVQELADAGLEVQEPPDGENGLDQEEDIGGVMAEATVDTAVRDRPILVGDNSSLEPDAGAGAG